MWQPGLATILLFLLLLTFILPGKLTDNLFSFAATAWGGGGWGMNEPIERWGSLGCHDGMRARLEICPGHRG